MPFAPRFAAAVAAATTVGALLLGPTAAGATQFATASATTVPPVPTVVTTVPLPTQSTSLTPVTAPVTSAPAINDAEATRLVNRIVAALVGLAVLVGLLTFWYWRATRPVPPALEGLDLVSSRKWLRSKPDKRARLLAEYRAKRGPVPSENIARIGGATVRVGAAVAAPSASFASGTSGAGATAGSMAASDAPASAASNRGEPPVPASSAASAAPVSPVAGTPATPAPDGQAAPDVARGLAPEAAHLHDATDEPPVLLVPEDADEDEAPSAPSSARPGDGDSVFTVVARRPRNDGDAVRPPEST